MCILCKINFLHKFTLILESLINKNSLRNREENNKKPGNEQSCVNSFSIPLTISVMAAMFLKTRRAHFSYLLSTLTGRYLSR